MKKNRHLILLFLLIVSPLHSQLPDKNKRDSRKAYNRGVELIHTDEYGEAIRYFEKSFELDKAFIDPLILKAKAKVELNDIEGAIEDFQGITLLDSARGEPWFYLGYLNFTGDIQEEILEYFDKAINLGFKDYQVYYYRGIYKLLMEDYTGAVSDLNEAIQKNEKLAEAYHDRATAKRNLGDLQGALYDYRMAVNYKQDFPLAFNNMGSVKMVLGDYEGALDDYDVAVNLDPDFYVALNNRGCIYYYLGDIELARTDFEEALSHSPDYLKAMNNMAGVVAKKNEYATAITIYNDIIESDNSFATAYLNRGLVKELTGDLEGACEDWNMALELGIEQAERYIKECD
ncbi:MAG: tetratricopeptide repeat protein [Bacteroidota bacterium]